MQRIAFLGLGAMGARMAARLLEAGCAVSVWNRTAERADPLAALGATIAATPRAAAEGAELVVSMLRDDAASSEVWLDPSSGALGGLAPGAIGAECSTLSLGQIKRLASAFHLAGRALLDAPVAGSRPQAEAGKLIFLVGGAAEDLATARPSLEIMGGAIHHAGGPGAGMMAKLMVNALFGVQLAAVAELVGFAEKAGFDSARMIEVLGETPVCSPAAKAAAQAMLASAFAPAFPIDLVAKDFDLIARSAGAVAADAPVSAAARAVYAVARDAGHGDENITAVARLYGSG